MPTLILFDIDGTILLTAGAGRRAIVAALRDEVADVAGELLHRRRRRRVDQFGGVGNDQFTLLVGQAGGGGGDGVDVPARHRGGAEGGFELGHRRAHRRPPRRRLRLPRRPTTMIGEDAVGRLRTALGGKCRSTPGDVDVEVIEERPTPPGLLDNDIETSPIQPVDIDTGQL